MSQLQVGNIGFDVDMIPSCQLDMGPSELDKNSNITLFPLLTSPIPSVDVSRYNLTLP